MPREGKPGVHFCLVKVIEAEGPERPESGPTRREGKYEVESQKEGRRKVHGGGGSQWPLPSCCEVQGAKG